MNFVIFDLEYNQGYNKKLNKTFSISECPFEIIQIGAVKTDFGFDITDTFNTYVNPVIYTILHPYVCKITKIRYSYIRHAPRFQQAAEDLVSFIDRDDDESIICTWNKNDIKELKRNLDYHNISFNKTYRYLDIQRLASIFFKKPSGITVGLENAVNELNIETGFDLHNALYDAFYSLMVFKRIIELLEETPESEQLEEYNYNLDIFSLMETIEI